MKRSTVRLGQTVRLRYSAQDTCGYSCDALFEVIDRVLGKPVMLGIRPLAPNARGETPSAIYLPERDVEVVR